MAKIIGVKVSENKEGKEFISLKLQGDAEAVQSLQTGKFYITSKSCYISCTFTRAEAEGFIGSELPGKGKHPSNIIIAKQILF